MAQMTSRAEATPQLRTEESDVSSSGTAVQAHIETVFDAAEHAAGTHVVAGAFPFPFHSMPRLMSMFTRVEAATRRAHRPTAPPNPYSRFDDQTGE